MDMVPITIHGIHTVPDGLSILAWDTAWDGDGQTMDGDTPITAVIAHITATGILLTTVGVGIPTGEDMAMVITMVTGATDILTLITVRAILIMGGHPHMDTGVPVPVIPPTG